MLHAFITLYREEIIRCCREKVATRLVPTTSNPEIDHAVALFLEQLVDVLRSNGSTGTRKIDQTAGQHGHDLFVQGFTVSQVIHGYGDICQSITELAMNTNTPFSTEDFQILNKCLDDAIAGAVTMYTRQSERKLLEPGRKYVNERMGFFSHELQRLVSTAVTAFDVLRAGDAIVSGSTGTVLKRSLTELQELAECFLTDLPLTYDSTKTRGSRKTHGSTTTRRISAEGSIEEVTAANTLPPGPSPRPGARIDLAKAPSLNGSYDRPTTAVHKGAEIRLVLQESDKGGWTAHSIVTPLGCASVTLGETRVFSTRELAGQVAYDAACNHIDRALRRQG